MCNLSEESVDRVIKEVEFAWPLAGNSLYKKALLMMSRVFFYGIKKFLKGRSHKSDFCY